MEGVSCMSISLFYPTMARKNIIPFFKGKYDPFGIFSTDTLHSVQPHMCFIAHAMDILTLIWVLLGLWASTCWH